MRVTVARALVDQLQAEGVDVLFGLAGSQWLDVLDVVYDRPDLRYIAVRDESSAGYAAYAYARVRHGLGACFATVGPGASNLLTGVAVAFKGRVPVLAITAKQQRREHETDDVQELDHVSMFRPVTRWSYLPPVADRFPQLLRKAIRTAFTDPRGPTHLNISKDLWQQEVELGDLAPVSYRPLNRPEVSAADVAQAAAIVAGARRPVVLAGGDAAWERAHADLIAFADATGIPVAHDIYHYDIFPADHPLSLGAAGRGGPLSANRALQAADVILAVGVQLDHITTLYNYDIIGREARIVHVGPTVQDMGDYYPVALALQGACGPFLRALAADLGRRPIWPDGEIAAWQAEAAAERQRDAAPSSGRLRSQHVINVMRQVVPRDTVITVDSGNFQYHLRRQWLSFLPDTYVDSDNIACLGAGLPMAMGAKAARPERPVVAVCGDGGFLMHAGELETCVRERLNVISLVLNDCGFGNIRAYQQQLFRGRSIGSEFGEVNFARLAESMGAHGERIERPEQIARAFERALAAGRPAVVECLTDPTDLAPGLYSPRKG